MYNSISTEDKKQIMSLLEQIDSILAGYDWEDCSAAERISNQLGTFYDNIYYDIVNLEV